MNPKVVVCTQETADVAKHATNLIENDSYFSNQDQSAIKLVSFGEVEGARNVFPIIETTDEKLAPQPKLFRANMTATTCQVSYQ